MTTVKLPDRRRNITTFLSLIDTWVHGHLLDIITFYFYDSPTTSRESVTMFESHRRSLLKALNSRYIYGRVVCNLFLNRAGKEVHAPDFEPSLDVSPLHDRQSTRSSTTTYDEPTDPAL